MRRREFITLFGGTAVTWPLVAGAQQRERIRRIGFLTSLGADDPVSLAYMAGLLHGLQELGWVLGRNVRLDPRWAATNVELKRRYAAELVGLALRRRRGRLRQGRRNRARSSASASCASGSRLPRSSAAFAEVCMRWD
jgi:hypothetical protein